VTGCFAEWLEGEDVMVVSVEGRVDNGVSIGGVVDSMAEDVLVGKLFTAKDEYRDEVDVGGDGDDDEGEAWVEETEPVDETVDD